MAGGWRQWQPTGVALLMSLGVGIGISVGIGVGADKPAIATPSTAEDYRIQGLAYRQQGRFDEAIAAMKTAVELDPDYVSGHVLLGWTQHLDSQATDATNTLTTAIQTDPFDVEAFNALGIVHLVQGHLYSAMLTHLWASHLKPDNEIAYFNLSLAAQRLGYYEWAIELATQAVELEPYNPHPLIAEAIAHWSLGHDQAAEARYRDAIALSPRYRTPQLPTYLKAAAFSPEQIESAQHIVEALR